MSPETLPLAYGVNEFTTLPWTFEEDVRNHAALGVEPLSPVSSNLETAFWTYRQAPRVVQEVDREHVGICPDLWNLWQDVNLVPDVRSAPDRLFLLQASNWRTPRSGTSPVPWGTSRACRCSSSSRRRRRATDPAGSGRKAAR